MDYPKSVPSVGLVNGKFVNEDAVAGLPGSLIPATWGNSVTDELLNVVKSAGLEPSETDATQLLQALKKSVRPVKTSMRPISVRPICTWPTTCPPSLR